MTVPPSGHFHSDTIKNSNFINGFIFLSLKTLLIIYVILYIYDLANLSDIYWNI